MYGSNHSGAAEKPVSQIACYTLVGLAIVFGAIAFWSKGVVPAVLLTAAFGALSFLLAGTVTRFAEAVSKGAKVTAAMSVAMGLVCLLFEANMTHLGLDHLNGEYAIAPDWALWPASFGLSLFNVFSVYAFAREIPEAKKPEARPVAKSADIILFGAADPKDRRSLEEIATKMRANGAL